MKIYPVFYILLLESADLRILILIKQSPKLNQDDKYKVKEIIGYDPRIR